MIFDVQSLLLHPETQRGLGRGSWDSSWAGRGGGSYVERGVPIYLLYTSCILPVPILPMHFLVDTVHTMQKAPRGGGAWELEADARHQKRKLLQLFVGTVLGDADIIVRSENNSLVIKSIEMGELYDDRVSEQVV